MKLWEQNWLRAGHLANAIRKQVRARLHCVIAFSPGKGNLRSGTYQVSQRNLQSVQAGREQEGNLFGFVERRTVENHRFQLFEMSEVQLADAVVWQVAEIIFEKVLLHVAAIISFSFAPSVKHIKSIWSCQNQRKPPSIHFAFWTSIYAAWYLLSTFFGWST